METRIPPKNTILALQERINTDFPELESRVVAVSEMEVNRANVPKLPICMLALQEINFIGNSSRTNKPPTVSEVIVAEFWFPSQKARLSEKSESPFWAFYDYDILLQKVIDISVDWQSPKGSYLQPVKADQESSELALMFSFLFYHTWEACASPAEQVGVARVKAAVSIKTCCEKTEI